METLQTHPHDVDGIEFAL